MNLEKAREVIAQYNNAVVPDLRELDIELTAGAGVLANLEDFDLPTGRGMFYWMDLTVSGVNETNEDLSNVLITTTIDGRQVHDKVRGNRFSTFFQERECGVMVVGTGGSKFNMQLDNRNGALEVKVVATLKYTQILGNNPAQINKAMEKFTH